MSTNYSSTEFKFIGGILCLDFINTVEGRSGASHQKGAAGDQYKIIGEKLRNYSDLVAWCRHEHAALLSPKDARSLIQLAEKHPRSVQTVFETAINLREALYRIFKAVANNRKPNPSDIESLDDVISNARAQAKRIFTTDDFATVWRIQ